MPFTCSICSEESLRICARCTKDSCDNHLCEKCFRCSDCCECEVMLSDQSREPARPVVRAMMDEAALEISVPSRLDEELLNDEELLPEETGALDETSPTEEEALTEEASQTEEEAIMQDNSRQPDEREPAPPQPTNGHPVDEPVPEPEPEPAATQPLSEI